MKGKDARPQVLALGHSTRPIETFILMLKGHSVATLVDIRTIPKSRHNPQFSEDALRAALSAEGIRYVQMKELGGLRRPIKGSTVNIGWLNDSFRGYADYMQTEQFETALNRLIELSRHDGPAAIMCAEGNPFRCHRSLVADALTVRGVDVIHISGRSGGRPHRMTPFARVAGTRVTYPAPADTN
jgi:uncharacterized protein (DUF488 family)